MKLNLESRYDFRKTIKSIAKWNWVITYNDSDNLIKQFIHSETLTNLYDKFINQHIGCDHELYTYFLFIKKEIENISKNNNNYIKK